MGNDEKVRLNIPGRLKKAFKAPDRCDDLEKLPEVLIKFWEKADQLLSKIPISDSYNDSVGCFVGRREAESELIGIIQRARSALPTKTKSEKRAEQLEVYKNLNKLIKSLQANEYSKELTLTNLLYIACDQNQELANYLLSIERPTQVGSHFIFGIPLERLTSKVTLINILTSLKEHYNLDEDQDPLYGFNEPRPRTNTPKNDNRSPEQTSECSRLRSSLTYELLDWFARNQRNKKVKPSFPRSTIENLVVYLIPSQDETELKDFYRAQKDKIDKKYNYIK